MQFPTVHQEHVDLIQILKKDFHWDFQVKPTWSHRKFLKQKSGEQTLGIALVILMLMLCPKYYGLNILNTRVVINGAHLWYSFLPPDVDFYN